MIRNHFRHLAYVSWPMLATLVLVAFLVPHRSFVAGQPPKEKAKFAGKWDGRFRDDAMKTGVGEYVLREDENGRITGTVSWIYEKQKQSMNLTGERLGQDTMRMTGEFGGISYRYIGGMAGHELKLHYESEDKKDGKLGFGLSRLTRPK